MARAEALAAESGCDAVELSVAAFNTEAIGFYQRLGYRAAVHRYARRTS